MSSGKPSSNSESLALRDPISVKSSDISSDTVGVATGIPCAVGVAEVGVAKGVMGIATGVP